MMLSAILIDEIQFGKEFFNINETLNRQLDNKLL